MASDVMVMSFVNWYFHFFIEESGKVKSKIFDLTQFFFLFFSSKRLFGKDVPTRSIWWTSTFEVVKWEMEREPKCGLCGPPSETSPE